MSTFPQLFAEKRTQLNRTISLHNQYATELEELRNQPAADPVRVDELRVAKARVSADLHEQQNDFDALEREAQDDELLTRVSNERHPGARRPGETEALFTLGDTRSTTMQPGDWVNANTGERAALRAGESFRSHPIVERTQNPNDAAAIAQFGGIGQLVRSLTTTSGSAVVPTVWAADLIDRARNASQVLQAGATIVPMDAKVVNIGRLTGDPSSAFRAENSPITPGDPTFDNVTLTATTQSALVIGSLEWFQDADNADEIVADAIAKAMAVQLDLAALYGGITAGAGSINLPTPPNPRGILAALNANLASNVLGDGTNGTTQTATAYFNEILDVIYQVRNGNEEPNALIWNSKLGRQYAGAYDTTGQPLRLPADVEDIKRLTSNQVPSYTKGTMTGRATDVFAGDFTKLLIGQRLGITIQTLTERYAENGQIGIVAHWRGDIQPARPSAFAVYRAIQGAL